MRRRWGRKTGVRWVVNVAIVGILLLAAACGDDEVATPEPTVPTSGTPSSTTEAAPADPFAIPPTIDAAYVDRVLVELNKVYGDVVRKIRATNRYERSDLDPLRAIFNDPLLELQVQAFAEIPANDPSLYRQPIGDRLLAVQELITVRRDCIFAEVLLDVSAVAKQPPPAQSRYVTLRPTQAAADPANVNPTPWSMSGESDVRQDQCVA